MKLEFSPLSIADLRTILEYISRDKPQAALNFVAQIEDRCKLLSTFPEIGTARDDLLPGLRLFTFRGYGIYYRTLTDLVRIERVLHPALEIRADLFEQ